MTDCDEAKKQCDLCGSTRDVRVWCVENHELNAHLLFQVCDTCAKAFFMPVKGGRYVGR